MNKSLDLRDQILSAMADDWCTCYEIANRIDHSRNGVETNIIALLQEGKVELRWIERRGAVHWSRQYHRAVGQEERSTK